MENSDINTGVHYFTHGNKTKARQMFLEVLKREPQNEMAWLWLAACVDKPEQKRDCLHKVLSINPMNTNAQKALAELEIQGISDTKPTPLKGTVLKCPSCGSVLGQPDHTGMIQCNYCGTTITYHPPTKKIDETNIGRYLEISNAALEGKNYDETLQYANKILEIDPENSDAWINKAIATFWLTTAANNRYDEAMGYLKKAEKFLLDNERITQVKEQLTRNQAEWLIYLGKERLKSATETYNIYHNGNYIDLTDMVRQPQEARARSREDFVEAMNFLLSAANYFPSDIDFLENIEALAKNINYPIYGFENEFISTLTK